MLDLKQYGYTHSGSTPDLARVTAVHRERYELICGEGPLFGKLKTSVYYGRVPKPFPTVGDFVRFQPVEGGDCQILGTLPRKSAFTRRDPDPVLGEQVVAANFDYVFIMTSLNQDFNINRIERYLTLAWQSGAMPVVILTKADLTGDTNTRVQAVQTAAQGVDVIPVSVVSGAGLERLDRYLQPGKTIVFLGMSGVGKSSLLNTLMQQEVMAVSAIREDDGRGRHTTTHRQLLRLPSGAMVIDTPGMRGLGLWDAEAGLSETFSDIEALLGNCRFSDCRHEREPGCAIREAINNGTLSPTRWENFQTLQQEAAYTQSKADFLRQKREKSKDIAKHVRQIKKNGRKT